MPAGQLPTDGDFTAAAAEGPFGFKPDRNRPIEPHFDGFGQLSPEQARQVLDVRDGRLAQCLLELRAESVLVEHWGQGYCDPATGRQWGYRIRRIGRDEPEATPTEPPPTGPTEEPQTAPVDAAPTPIEPTPASRPTPPRPRFEWAVAKPAPKSSPRPEPAVEDLPLLEVDEDWSAPDRSPRATAFTDRAERTALVRVLILWFVVALLTMECVALISGTR